MKSEKQPPSDSEPGSKGPWIRAIGLFSVIVAQLVGPTAIGGGGCYLLMTHFGWPGWVILPGAMLGFGIGIFQVYQLSEREWNRK